MKALIFCFLFSLNAFAEINLQSLKTADGKSFETKSSYSLVYFWATWCPDCKAKLKETLQDVKIPNLNFTTVNTDKDQEMAKDFLLREKITAPVAFDASKEVRKSLKVFSVPNWSLLKKAGEQWIIVKSGVELDLNEIKALMK